MSSDKESKEKQKPQHQDRQPGSESTMEPEPSHMPRHPGAGKLEGRVAIVTGGDSGIGRAVAIAFAREGCDLAIVYLDEHGDAAKTADFVKNEGRECITLAGDVGDETFCADAVEKTVERFSRLDILVNNAGEQHVKESIEEISKEQLERTFRTNIFSFFYMTKAALKHLHEGAAIVNSASVTAYRGSRHLIDYASTKGAIVAFTRSLASSLVKRGIRVNAVAPGPIWTPLIPATFPPDYVKEFGSSVPLGRAGQPEEVAPCYVFLASDDASYMTGQVLHPNGGEIVNG